MDRYLRDMPAVPQGTPPAKIVTPTRINAIQDSIKELAKGGRGGGGAGGRAAADRHSRRPRFLVWYQTAEQRLYVTEGRVATVNAAVPDQVTRPVEPTLDGVPLKDSPYWSVAGKTVGVDYEVLCVSDPSGSRLVLQEASEDLVMDPCERAWLVATVRFANSGGKKIVETLSQDWSGEITHVFDDSDCSGDAGSGSGGGGSGSDSDLDSDSDSGGGGDASGSGSDGDGDGDPSNDCCPTLDVTAFIVRVGVGNAECFSNANVPEEVEVAVTGSVGEIPCELCEGYLWVEFGIGSMKASRFLGLKGGQSFGERFIFAGVACQELRVWARVRRFGVPVPPNDETPVCEQMTGCEEEFFFQLPAVCGEDCSDSDSDSGSDPGSDPGSDSGGGSGSDPGSDPGSDLGSDPGSDKNCIVPLRDRFVALACVESPGTWFVDYLEQAVEIRGRRTRVAIDPDFLEVCAPGTLKVVAAVPDRAAAVGAWIENGRTLVVESGWLRRARRVEVTLAGKRAGSLERFPERTRAQWEKSREFWTELNR